MLVLWCASISFAVFTHSIRTAFGTMIWQIVCLFLRFVAVAGAYRQSRWRVSFNSDLAMLMDCGLGCSSSGNCQDISSRAGISMHGGMVWSRLNTSQHVLAEFQGYQTGTTVG